MEAEDDASSTVDNWIMQQAELLASMREAGTNDDTQAEVLAIMRGRFQRSGARGAPGQRPPFRPTGGTMPAAPPRGLQDMSCVNCGEKGHIANKCPKPQTDPKDRPCSTFKKGA